jgi:hypothetical protein
MHIMEEHVDGFIKMNMEGRILELGAQYYDEHITMSSNGEEFASSRDEATAKQKPYVESIAAFVITLIAKEIKGDIAEITFHYDITTKTNENYAFTGKHIQTWKNGKITHEEYIMIH